VLILFDTREGGGGLAEGISIIFSGGHRLGRSVIRRLREERDLNLFFGGGVPYLFERGGGIFFNRVIAEGKVNEENALTGSLSRRKNSQR